MRSSCTTAHRHIHLYRLSNTPGRSSSARLLLAVRLASRPVYRGLHSTGVDSGIRSLSSGGAGVYRRLVVAPYPAVLVLVSRHRSPPLCRPLRQRYGYDGGHADHGSSCPLASVAPDSGSLRLGVPCGARGIRRRSADTQPRLLQRADILSIRTQSSYTRDDDTWRRAGPRPVAWATRLDSYGMRPGHSGWPSYRHPTLRAYPLPWPQVATRSSHCHLSLHSACPFHTSLSSSDICFPHHEHSVTATTRLPEIPLRPILWGHSRARVPL